MLLRRFPEKSEFLSLAQTKNVIPVCAEILADMETPVSLLKKVYRKKGPIFLFESVEGGERWGRYSFLGTSANRHVRVFKDHVEIETQSEKQKIEHHNDPLKVLREFMAQFVPADVTGLPRFWGGLVGYMTYETVSFFEKIPNKWPENKPLAHFIVPDEMLIFDNIRHILLGVAICFVDEKNSAQDAYDRAFERIDKLVDMIDQPLPATEKENKAHDFQLAPVLDDTIYPRFVQETKEYIRQGDIIQAVISQPFECKTVPDILTLYRAQRYINPSPYLYFIHMDEIALIGSSPETMVRLENKVATLRPIAGTRPRGKNEQEDRALADELLGDEKERAEHLMLVDLGRNDLGRVAQVGTVQVTDLMVVERYSHVMHLVSNICCDLNDGKDAWDLLAATFPAGTLSGAPKVRAMEIIAELEQEPRGPYGGAVGYVSFSGNMDLAITIRTACITNNQLVVRAGAGIVADSDPEREKQETINKAMAIQKALHLIQNK